MRQKILHNTADEYDGEKMLDGMERRTLNRITEKLPNGYVRDRVIISLHKRCSYPYVSKRREIDFLRRMGIREMEVIFRPNCHDDEDDVGVIYLAKVQQNDIRSVLDIIAMLNTQPCVVLAELDYILDAHMLPNDQYFRYLWGMGSIHAPLAWDVGHGSYNVSVGVIDSGIDFYHPDLMDNIVAALDERSFDIAALPIAGDNRQANEQRQTSSGQFESGSGERQSVSGSFSIEQSAMDITGHGTHVAGTIGAVGNNYIGVTGVCWNVGIYSLKIGNAFMDIAAAIKAIDYASHHNIDVLNGSWGGWVDSESLEFAIAHYEGLFVASAGNNSSNNDLFPVYPASYELDNIISVAAVDRSGELAFFSNYGKNSVDIAAPGMDILSTDIMSRYSYMDGTSMAAPHVVGAAALLKSIQPSLTSLQIKEILLLNSDPHPSLQDKILTSATLNINKAIRRLQG